MITIFAKRARWLAGILTGTFAPIIATAQHPIPVPHVERYTLPNGLTVLLSPNHSTPVVVVEVCYHVGSKNERPGRTGFAHLFEHVMFQGSQHIPNGMHFKTVENAGGEFGGTTTEDATSYSETIPSNHLAQALWLESDRMGFLLPALDQAKLDAQRRVVKNERRQGTDNQPYGVADEVLVGALFPPTNPYSWPAIGSMADLSAASLADVRQFFQTYYGPNNATLAVVGDFTPATAKALIAKYFGPIPAGPPITRPVVAPVTLAQEKRLVLEDRQTQLPQLTIAWPTVGEDHPDHIALGMLQHILTGDRTSGLTKLLVYQRQLAMQVTAHRVAFENAGYFEIHVDPRPSASLTEIERLVDSVVHTLATTAPTAREVNRFKPALRVDAVFNVDGALNNSELLLAGETFHHDPLALLTMTQQQLAVTPDEVARVARQYLMREHVVLSMVPAGQLAQIAQPTLSYTNVTPAPEIQQTTTSDSSSAASIPPVLPDIADYRSIMPPAERAKPMHLPVVQRRVLANGASVVVLEDHRLPVVAVNAVLDLSPLLDPPGKTGLAQIVQEMLGEGTTTRSADQLADAVAELGNSVSALRFFTMTDHVAPSLSVMADQLLHPAFPDSALTRRKVNLATEIRETAADPSALVSRIFASTIYGKTHPYARTPTEAEVMTITHDDVVRFDTTYVRPPNVTFVVTGDITPAQAVAQLNRVFGSWSRGVSGHVDVPVPAGVASTAIYLYDRPGSSQSALMIGNVGPRRDAPDIYALQLMNTTLGGTHTSRLLLNLREQHGYTYGVRSRLQFRRIPELGTFAVKTAVMTAKTDSAVIQTMQELRDIRTTRPVTPQEFTFAKALATQGLPVQLETFARRAQAMTKLVQEGLPLDYYQTLQQRYQSVTLAQDRAAARDIDPTKLAIVIVGDRTVLEPKLQAAGIAPIVQVAPLP